MELQGGWSKQIWLGLYLKLVAVVGFLIQILLIFFEISFRIQGILNKISKKIRALLRRRNSGQAVPTLGVVFFILS